MSCLVLIRRGKMYKIVLIIFTVGIIPAQKFDSIAVIALKERNFKYNEN